MEELFNIVLVHPEIPQNTGGIGRLCVATGCGLSLIEPLGFSLDDKYVKRAGMDYWTHLNVNVFKDWDAFTLANGVRPMYFFSTHGQRSFWDCPYEKGSALVFGRESAGLPEEFYARYADSLYSIPMPGEFSRSLNLANSAAIALYEGLRRWR